MHREVGASHPQGEKYLNLTTMLRSLLKRWAEFLWISQIPAPERRMKNLPFCGPYITSEEGKVLTPASF